MRPLHSRARRLVIVPIIAAVLLSSNALESHARTVMFVCQVFPQMPFRPLDLMGAEPLHFVERLESPNGPIVAEVFQPTARFGSFPRRSRPALILAMGIKTAPRDRPHLIELGRTFARLGFVVLWPRSQVLDDGISLPEEPGTFVAGVHYLRDVDLVDPERISLLGFSTGATASLLAASSPEVDGMVRSVIFFGGYYDLSEYLLSLASASIVVYGHQADWEPSGEAVGHVREILTNKGLYGLSHALESPRAQAADLLRAAPSSEMEELRRFNPAQNELGFRGHLFILHDTGDPLVPSVQSAALYRAVSEQMATTYVETSLFDHVQPKKDLSWDSIASIVRLYGFVNGALSYI